MRGKRESKAGGQVRRTGDVGQRGSSHEFRRLTHCGEWEGVECFSLEMILFRSVQTTDQLADSKVRPFSLLSLSATLMTELQRPRASSEESKSISELWTQRSRYLTKTQLRKRWSQFSVPTAQKTQ